MARLQERKRGGSKIENRGSRIAAGLFDPRSSDESRLTATAATRRCRRGGPAARLAFLLFESLLQVVVKILPVGQGAPLLSQGVVLSSQLAALRGEVGVHLLPHLFGQLLGARPR
jgi:hypothetical protein